MGKVDSFQALMVFRAKGEQISNAQIQLLDGFDGIDKSFAVQVPTGLVNLLGSNLSAKLGRALLDVPKSLKKWVEGPAGNRYRVMTAKR